MGEAPDEGDGMWVEVLAWVDRMGVSGWRMVQVPLQELAMGILCRTYNASPDEFLAKLNEDIDFLTEIDGCNK